MTQTLQGFDATFHYTQYAGADDWSMLGLVVFIPVRSNCLTPCENYISQKLEKALFFKFVLFGSDS